MNTHKNKIILSNLSNHMRFRETARELFKNIKENTIFDFDKVETVSRSFAHEFILQKEKKKEKIEEKNMSPSVKRVFELARTNNKEARFNRDTWEVKTELEI